MPVAKVGFLSQPRIVGLAELVLRATHPAPFFCRVKIGQCHFKSAPAVVGAAKRRGRYVVAKSKVPALQFKNGGKNESIQSEIRAGIGYLITPMRPEPCPKRQFFPLPVGIPQVTSPSDAERRPLAHDHRPGKQGKLPGKRHFASGMNGPSAIKTGTGFVQKGDLGFGNVVHRSAKEKTLVVIPQPIPHDSGMEVGEKIAALAGKGFP